jgi:hypothetical protein
MLRRTLITLLVSSIVLGCSDSADPDRGVEGTWRLERVNGQALPFVVPDDNWDKLEILGDVFTLVAPNDFTEVTTFRITDGSNVSTDVVPSDGTYTFDGTTITMTWKSDGSVFTAIVTGETMTMVDGALTFVYRRE